MRNNNLVVTRCRFVGYFIVYVCKMCIYTRVWRNSLPLSIIKEAGKNTPRENGSGRVKVKSISTRMLDILLIPALKVGREGAGGWGWQG